MFETVNQLNIIGMFVQDSKPCLKSLSLAEPYKSAV